MAEGLAGARLKEARRTVHSLRLKDSTRERLIASAKKNERSLSEELETRIDESFLREDRAGGNFNRALADTLIATANISEAIRGKPWISNRDEARYTYARLILAIGRAMELEPRLEQIANENDRIEAEAYTALAITDDIIEDTIRNPPSTNEPEIINGARMSRAVMNRYLELRMGEIEVTRERLHRSSPGDP